MTDQNVHPDSPVVLVASPFSDDYGRLAQILKKTDLHPRVQSADSVHTAMAVVYKMPVPVAVVERDLPDGTWRKLLDEFQHLPARPLLIVASTHADEYLWAEALNLGAFDVLAKPFDAAEVMRVVTWACLRWCEINKETGGSERLQKKCASAVAQTTTSEQGHRQLAIAAAH